MNKAFEAQADNPTLFMAKYLLDLNNLSLEAHCEAEKMKAANSIAVYEEHYKEVSQQCENLQEQIDSSKHQLAEDTKPVQIKRSRTTDSCFTQYREPTDVQTKLPKRLKYEPIENRQHMSAEGYARKATIQQSALSTNQLSFHKLSLSDDSESEDDDTQTQTGIQIKKEGSWTLRSEDNGVDSGVKVQSNLATVDGIEPEASEIIGLNFNTKAVEEAIGEAIEEEENNHAVDLSQPASDASVNETICEEDANVKAANQSLKAVKAETVDDTDVNEERIICNIQGEDQCTKTSPENNQAQKTIESSLDVQPARIIEEEIVEHVTVHLTVPIATHEDEDDTLQQAMNQSDVSEKELVIDESDTNEMQPEVSNKVSMEIDDVIKILEAKGPLEYHEDIFSGTKSEAQTVAADINIPQSSKKEQEKVEVEQPVVTTVDTIIDTPLPSSESMKTVFEESQPNVAEKKYLDEEDFVPDYEADDSD